MDAQTGRAAILFYCADAAHCSRMAAAFARAKGFEAVCAAASEAEEVGDALGPLDEVLAEIDLDLSGVEVESLESLRSRKFDIVVSLSRNPTEPFPVLVGNPSHLRWNVAALDAPGEEGETPRSALRRVRDTIVHMVDDLLDQGYLQALVQSKRQADLILNNLSEGILAHDMERRIFYFNDAAERITGYARRDVLGKDCHDVFPGNLCGGQCSFCDGATPDSPNAENRNLEIRAKNGAKRDVAMAVRTMRDSQSNPMGVLVSFRDETRERQLERRLGEIEQFSGIIGRDSKMLEIFELIRDVADSNVSVLIQGESGTGKELVAAAIHRESPRASRLFVPVNCGALPEGLLESELFGHVRGAFTGAVRDKKGRFELADGGTIFLDEIGDISPAMQVKLLRVLQEGTFERVGSEKTVRVDARIISATNKNLLEETQAGRFREDLFYRLSVMPIHLPPLRERRTDVPLLARHILKRFREEHNRPDVALADDALSAMLSYDWPGNVRELQNWIQFALIKSKGDLLEVKHLPPHSRTVPPRQDLPERSPTRTPAPEALEPTRKRRRRKLSLEAVQQALDQVGGNKVLAAKELGVSRATLYRFLDEAEKRKPGA